MKKRIYLRALSALLLLAALLTAVSCASTEDTLIPEGMQSATAYDATYRLYVPTTWSLKVLPGVSGAYYNVAEQSAVSVSEYPIDEALAAELNALGDSTSRINYYFEKTLFAQVKLMATGDIHLYEEDCIATLLGDANARQYHYSATVSGVFTHFLQIVAERDNRFYVFSFTATEALYEHCMQDVKKMLEHFGYGKPYRPSDSAKNISTDATAPTGMKIASGNEVQYFFYVPSSWDINVTDTVYAATAPDGSFVSVIPYLPSADGISVREYFEKSEEMMRSTSGNRYTRIEEKEIPFSGSKALQYEYEYTVGGVTYRYLQVIAGYQGMIYNLTYTSLPQNFEANRADVEAIIAAFSFR